jgi:EmrB/QacA subfamily drug resistance transporter
VTSLTPATPALRDVLVALMSAIFLGALDQTIVAVSLPAISAQFADVTLLAWVVAGYMVAMTVATPLYGKLGDLYGRRPMLLIGMGLFTGASLFCGLAQSMEQLVLARILQGIGAGGMISVSQAIIGDVVPPRERGRYQGYFSSMYAVASVAGPVLGGLLTEHLSWRWVFWLNLPLGAAAWWYIRRTLAGLRSPQRQARIDYLGSVLLVVGLSGVLLAVTEVGQGRAWHSGSVLGLFVMGGLALFMFALQERRFVEPILPLRLFAAPTAVLCWCTVFMTSFQSISLSVIAPLRYQSLTGAGADSAALFLMPLAMGLPIGAFLGGRHTARSGRFKPVILAGALLVPVGVLGMAFTAVGNLFMSGLFMVLTGIGCGLQFPTSLVGAQNAAQPQDIGVSTSTTNLFRSLGGATGVAVMSALLLALLGSDAGLGEGAQGNALLHSLGPQAPATGQLSDSFRELLCISAGLSLLGLAAAARMPNALLRGRG